MPINDFVTIKEYASGIGITPDAIRMKINGGRLPEAVKVGNQWMVPVGMEWTDHRRKETRK